MTHSVTSQSLDSSQFTIHVAVRNVPTDLAESLALPHLAAETWRSAMLCKQGHVLSLRIQSELDGKMHTLGEMALDQVVSVVSNKVRFSATQTLIKPMLSGLLGGLALAAVVSMNSGKGLEETLGLAAYLSPIASAILTVFAFLSLPLGDLNVVEIKGHTNSLVLYVGNDLLSTVLNLARTGVIPDGAALDAAPASAGATNAPPKQGPHLDSRR